MIKTFRMKKILKLKKKKLIEIFKFRDLLNNIKLDFQMYKINKLPYITSLKTLF